MRSARAAFAIHLKSSLIKRAGDYAGEGKLQLRPFLRRAPTRAGRFQHLWLHRANPCVANARCVFPTYTTSCFTQVCFGKCAAQHLETEVVHTWPHEALHDALRSLESKPPPDFDAPRPHPSKHFAALVLSDSRTRAKHDDL